MPSPRPGDPAGIKRAKNAPKAIGRKIEEVGPKKWAGEGKMSAGVGKPKIFVLNDGKNQGIGTVLLFAGHSSDLTDKAQDQLKQLAPALAR